VVSLGGKMKETDRCGRFLANFPKRTLQVGRLRLRNLGDGLYKEKRWLRC